MIMEVREDEYWTFENLEWGIEDSNDSSFPIIKINYKGGSC